MHIWCIKINFICIKFVNFIDRIGRNNYKTLCLTNHNVDVPKGSMQSKFKESDK